MKMNVNWNKVINKTIFVLLGSIISGLGIALAVSGGHGGDPLAVMYHGIGEKLGITLGQANLIGNLVMFVIAYFVDRKHLNVGTIANPVLLAASIDVFLPLFKQPSLVPIQMIQSIIGVALIGVGIGIYTAANVGKAPYDALVFGLVSKYNLKIFTIRMLADAIFLIAGWALGAYFGIATIISVVIIGKIIEKTNGYCKKLFREENLVTKNIVEEAKNN
jgi:uncharacterized protein